MRSYLKAKGVTLLGGGLDEAPDAYKDSRKVIAAQNELVKVWGEFHPVIVRMAADGQSLGSRHEAQSQGRSVETRTPCETASLNLGLPTKCWQPFHIYCGKSMP